jgi:putative spermidine/putrescine transport system permease protein
VGRPRAGLVAALLVAAPVLVGVGYATLAALGLAGAGAAGFTTARVARVLAERATWAGLAWSLWVAGASTLLATAGAALVALAFRGAGALDRAGRLLAALPLPVPHLVAAALGVQLLGQSGLVARAGHALGLVAGPADVPALLYDPLGTGLILTMAWKELPFLAVVAASVLATRGASAEEAARTLGAGRWATLSLVTWPLLWRGLMPAVVAVFVFVAGNYEVAALMAPSDPLALPLLTAERAVDPDLARRGDAYVLALVALGVGALAVAAHEAARARWGATAE